MTLDSKETVMMTVKLDAARASIAEAAKQLGLPVTTVDPGFGLVPIDRDAGLYAVKIARSAAPAPARGRTASFRGPFSNPRISSFGFTKKDLAGR